MRKLLLGVLVIIIALMLPTSIFAEDNYDSYIVKYKDGCTPVSMSTFSLSCDGEGIEPIVEDWNMYKVDKENLAYLDMSQIEYIEPNYKLELYFEYTPNDTYYQYQWSLPMIKMPYVWEKGYFGEGIKVAVIDSGIDLKHLDLHGYISEGNCVDFSGSGYFEETLPEYYAINNSANNHGTSVASVISSGINNGNGIAGVSKAQIYMLKVFRAVKLDGNTITYMGEVSNTISALHYAVNNIKCDVVNMSLGFSSDSGGEIPATNETMKSLRRVIDFAYQNGTILVAASGNDGDKGNAISYPAYSDHVISVGSVNAEKAISPFSTYNKMLDVVAPGEGVLTACGYYPEEDDGRDVYSFRGGTSFAAPHIAGICAVAKGINRDITQDDIELLIKYSCEDLGSGGRDDYYGWGLIDANRLITLVDTAESELAAGYPTYDATKDELTLNYFNSSNTTQYTGVSSRAIVYDENGVLTYISGPTEITVPAFSEQSYSFEGIDIPNGGCAKILCMSDWQKMVPATNVAVYRMSL